MTRAGVGLLLATLATAACRAPVEESPWYVGTWEGTRTSLEDGEASPMRAEVRSVLGGQGILRELEVVHGGGTYRGVSLDVAEVDSGVWKRTYVNEPRGRFVVLIGDGSPVAGAVVWRSEIGESGRWSEVTCEPRADGTWRALARRTVDGGETWSELFLDELVRVAE